MPNQDLIDGIDALQAGKITEAQTSLIKTVRAHPDSQDGWFWLGQLLDDPNRKRYCYLRVLSINPDNSHAWLALSKIGVADAELPKPAMAVAAPEAQIRRQLDESENSEYSIAEESTQASPILNWKGLLLGCLISMLLIILPAGYIILQGYLDNYLIDSRKVDLPPMPMLIETWVDTYSPAAPLSIPDEPYEERYLKAEPIIDNAKLLHETGNYSDAIEEFSDALRYIPENPDVYFHRSLSSISRVVEQTSLLGQLYDIYMALSDMDRAIELQPDMGDYYAVRGGIYYKWAGLHSLSVNNTKLFQQAIDNFNEASRLGHSNVFPVDLLHTSALVESGQCEQALTTIQAYLEVNNPELEHYAAIEKILPYAYTCMGDFDNAMNSFTGLVQENALTPGEMRLKAIILYQQGKPEEALQEINTLTSLYPGFDSDHYYLRGLIYFENGNWDAAYNDLMYRQAYNKTDVGLYVYVQGLMALRLPGNLNHEKAIAALQYAEASISPLYPAIKEKIQDQLLSMNVGVEEATSSVPQATPLPAYTPLPTARPTQLFTSTPQAVDQKETGADSTTSDPTMPSVVLLPSLEEIHSIVDIGNGSGPFSLAMGIDRAIRFQPEIALSIQSVDSLKIFLESDQTQVEAPVLKLWNIRTGDWTIVHANWGSTKIDDPFEYVTPQGDVYLSVTSQEKATLIENIEIQLVILDVDDQTQRYGRR